MKQSHTYKFAFYALVGLILMFGIAKCTAQVAPDKKMHGYAGAVSSMFFSTFSMPQNELWKPAIYGMIGATGLGVSKELFDFIGGTPEWADLGATMFGAAISMGVIIIVKKIILYFKTPKQFSYAGQRYY